MLGETGPVSSCLKYEINGFNIFFCLAFVEITLPGKEHYKEIELWQIYPTESFSNVNSSLFLSGSFHRGLLKENVDGQ